MRNDPDFINPVVNLANVAYLTEDYNLALQSYTRVEELLEQRGEIASPSGQTILINISQTLRELERFDDSRAYFARAEAIDPEGVAEFAHLGSGGTSRASGVNNSVLFLGEE
jgi:tetratricopeptide (TPR) repeat protein